MPTRATRSGPPAMSLAPGLGRAQRVVHFGHECVARSQARRHVAPDADRHALVVAEPALDREPEPLGEDHVVAHGRVEVERNVRGVERDVVLEQRRDPAIAPAGQRDVAVPEQSVVHQQERRGTPARPALGDHAVDRRLRGVHRGHDAADQPAVLDLEAVDGVALVRDLADAQVLVQIANHLRERHGADVVAGLAVHHRYPASVERTSPGAPVPLCLCSERTVGPGWIACIDAGRGAGTSVPAAIESAAAFTRALSAAGTRRVERRIRLVAHHAAREPERLDLGL